MFTGNIQQYYNKCTIGNYNQKVTVYTYDTITVTIAKWEYTAIPPVCYNY